ncbi:tetratricopeptide repeat protein [Orientia tsutsugamushi]|uniref:Tetratricopeptide repeat protein with 2 trp repeats n=1 Tax=Orientia tsutsugamushi (strain Boryong) TaxID=357244 RepID=A5CE34_ORITB|nr:tetratricopeptide repeat protein [Orientia tsutsugamushi]CAM80259.1 tetratricopeptide repeat protein with 2 trp repeats [Orientia tsutsugamushi str. Boryong]
MYAFYSLLSIFSLILNWRYYNKGICLSKLEQYKEAIESFDLAIKYKPNHANAYCNKGVCLYKLGQHQEVIVNFDLAIKYDPNNGTLYKLINILRQEIAGIKK